MFTASAEMLRQLRMTEDDLNTSDRLEDVLTARTHPDDVEKLREVVIRAMSTGEPFAVEDRFIAADGSVRTYRTRGEIVRDADGRPLRLRGSHQDITDERTAEQALAAAAASREAADRERRIADELQRSLVPTPTFVPDDLEIVTFYRPGVQGTQVGGDWYDVIDLGAGRTALVLGDVMGRGVRAAAVMGQLRAAVRAYARLDLPPVDVLGLLDTTVRELGEDQLVTCVYAVYDPDDGAVTYANAGHLPPILRVPGRPPERLAIGAGLPLGVGPTTVAARQIPLPAGAVLVLYTDGLVERRGADIDAGIDRLTALIADTGRPVGELSDHLVDSLVPGGPDDDVALLIAAAREGLHPTRTIVLGDGSLEGATGEAGAFVAAALAEWRMSARADQAAVAVRELVAHAVLAGRPPIEVRLRATPTELVLQVHDTTTTRPRPRRAVITDELGPGLHEVARVATRWGIRPTATGRAVWCTVRPRT